MSKRSAYGSSGLQQPKFKREYDDNADCFEFESCKDIQPAAFNNASISPSNATLCGQEIERVRSVLSSSDKTILRLENQLKEEKDKRSQTNSLLTTLRSFKSDERYLLWSLEQALNGKKSDDATSVASVLLDLLKSHDSTATPAVTERCPTCKCKKVPVAVEVEANPIEVIQAPILLRG